MKVEYSKENNTVSVYLSRRNVLGLLHKADQEWSGKTLIRRGDPTNLEAEPHLTVVVESDAEHYKDRGYGPGPAHPETEAFIEKHAPTGCGKCPSEGSPLHSCPYDADIHGKTTMCRCCEGCTTACSDEI